MLTTWLIELFLNELGTLSDCGDMRSFERLQQEFYAFLSQDYLKARKGCGQGQRMNVYFRIVLISIARQCTTSSPVTVRWKTWSSLPPTWKVRPLQCDLTALSTLTPTDYEKVITHCIQHSNFTEALKVLTGKAAHILKQPEKERRTRFKPFAELFYKFSPALVKKCPRETVDAWITMGKHLEPHKLIPALIQCNQPVDSAQVREQCCSRQPVMQVWHCRCLQPFATWSSV